MSMITTEKRGHIAILTLNRPESMNALGAAGDGDQVQAACAAINADQNIRAVGSEQRPPPQFGRVPYHASLS